jgi:undecaprenyl-diphosphatase
LLGVLQGFAEWLPVSSEGLVTVAYSAMTGRDFLDAVHFALWLHLGTAFSAIVAFKRDLQKLFIEFLSEPTNPSRMIIVLAATTIVSVVVGFPLLLLLDFATSGLGVTVMVFIGAAMFITGLIQWKRRVMGDRAISTFTWKDILLVGIAQGFSVLPGFSRSGLTVTVLLARRTNQRLALQISFLLSIPASLGAAFYVGIKGEFLGSIDGVIAGGVAFLVGLVTVKVLLNVVERVNFGILMMMVGVLIFAGSFWQVNL